MTENWEGTGIRLVERHVFCSETCAHIYPGRSTRPPARADDAGEGRFAHAPLLGLAVYLIVAAIVGWVDLWFIGLATWAGVPSVVQAVAVILATVLMLHYGLGLVR